MPSEFEEIIEQIGAFGPYQVRVFILVSMFETPLAWAMLLPALTSAKPPWICLDDLDPFPNSTDNIYNGDLNSTFNVSMNFTSTCAADGKACQNTQFTSEFTSIVSEWHLICDQTYVSTLITSVQMAGVLCGAMITGQLADVFGRKKVLFGNYALLLMFWVASSFSNSWPLYCALRFFVGGLVGGTLVVNFVLPLEFVTPKWRTFCGCVGFWAVGLMTLGLLGYFIEDWSHLTLSCAVIGIPILFSWWFIPESPRWLADKGRYPEAEAILIDMAKFNKKPIPDFTRLKAFSEREKSKKLEQKKYSYWHLFQSWYDAKNTLILMYGWFVSSCVYYGMSLNTRNLAGNRYLNLFISGFVEIPALILVLIIHNKLGRKRTASVMFGVGGLFCFAILILDLTGNMTTYPQLVLALAMVGKSGIAGGWAAVQVFSAEVFPTVVRNLGVGACSMASRIGGIVAPQLVLLSDQAMPMPFTVFGVIAVLFSILALFLPETAGIPLPEVLPDRSNHVSKDIANRETDKCLPDPSEDNCLEMTEKFNDLDEIH